jgi:hypothetical protein
MPKGLGKRQRDILAKLAEHRDNPPNYNPSSLSKWRHDKYPEWMTVRELAGPSANAMHCHHLSDVESTRRAVRKLEVAGLVQTQMIRRDERGMRQIGVRLVAR